MAAASPVLTFPAASEEPKPFEHPSVSSIPACRPSKFAIDASTLELH